jgi:hypothetical protein
MAETVSGVTVDRATAAATSPATAPRSRLAPWGALALALLAAALYLPNADDYFLADDFDLIRSFYGKPATYFVELLYSNESGDVWADWGIDAAKHKGFLRPIKIWLLAAQLELWGARPVGFHLTSIAAWVGLVLMVRRILTRFVPGREEIALVGAAIVAIHPLFSEVVPWITATEELVSILFGLVALDALLAHRRSGGPAWPFYTFFVLALLTKESGITVLGLALGYDLVAGRIVTRSRARIAATVRFYAPFVPILAVYFALRLAAFGSFKGGDAITTGYLEPWVFFRFHRLFHLALLDPTMLSIGGRAWTGVAAAVAAIALFAMLAIRARTIPDERWRDLVFLGPVWYAASTAVLFGSHFALRRNGLPLVGLVAFLAVALVTLLDRASRRVRLGVAGGVLLVAAALFVPPSLRNSRDFDEASRDVRDARAEIERETVDLPDGCAVGLANVPQSMVAPYWFGWGLLSALREPFTPTDLAGRCTVYDARHRFLNRNSTPPPERFDRVLEFPPGLWVSPEDARRELARLRQIGLVARPEQ